MKLGLLSIDGNSFSPNYQAEILYPRQLRLQATPNLLDLAGAAPAYTGKSFGGGYLSIMVKYLNTLPEDVHIREAEISRWFDTLNEEPVKLLAEDTADSDRQWYLMVTPLSIIQDNDSAIIQLLLDEPYWAVETTSTSTWTITASGQTKTITNLGNVARPIIKITPTSARTGGYNYKRFVEVLCPSYRETSYVFQDQPNLPVNLGAFDTAALVTAGKAQSDGDDFRVMVDGVEVPRWFGSGSTAFNTTTTNIWVVLDMKKQIYFYNTEIDSISAVGSVTELSYKKKATVYAKLDALPEKGIIKYLNTSSQYEYFSYTGKDLANYKLTGVTRSVKGTTARAFSYSTTPFPMSSDSATFIQHDVSFIYGNSSATAPVYDESHKPIFNLGTSTRSSWVYEEFYEEGKPRAGAWTKSLFTSTLGTSAPYTGNQGATANPATEAGLRMATAKVNGIEAAENAVQAWTLSVPGGIDSITTMTGEKYRFSSDWPTTEIQKSTSSQTYQTAQAISTPASAGAWSSWSITSLLFTTVVGAFPTIFFMRLLQSGSLPALASNRADVEIEGCTIAVSGYGGCDVSVRSEYLSTYYLEAIITNVTTGDAMTLTWSMRLNEMLIVDCDARTVTYQDGTNALAAITLNSDRVDWLNIEYGSTQLMYEETGAAGLTVVLEWKDKAVI